MTNFTICLPVSFQPCTRFITLVSTSINLYELSFYDDNHVARDGGGARVRVYVTMQHEYSFLREPTYFVLLCFLLLLFCFLSLFLPPIIKYFLYAL